jgi:type VI secretion system protein ImpH
VIAEIGSRPHEFNFYTALRMLQAAAKDLPRLGTAISPSQEPVRFAQSPSLTFAPSTLEAVQQKSDDSAPVLYCRHFGLFGPNGPLPLAYTEYAHDRILHQGDPTLAAFCNIFHHRFIEFFFRAWADAQKAVDFDRVTDERWSQFVASLIGLGMDSMRNRDHVPDRSKLYFAGRLAQQSRNAEGLEAVIQDFFGVPTEVQPFVGRWLDLPPDSQCRLGESPETGKLGLTTIVGSRHWTCQMHFSIRLGPMGLSDYERMLPSGASFPRLKDWVREYTADQYSWDARLVLRKDEVPCICLGKAGRLGWTTWLKTVAFQNDADDLVVIMPLTA